MKKYNDKELEALVKELQTCDNPHELPKDSKLAAAIIDNCGKLSHNNLNKFTKIILNELVKRVKKHIKHAKMYWDLLESKI